MSSAADRSDRIRRREEDEERNDSQAAEAAQSASQLSDQPAGATAAAGSTPADPSAAAAQPTQPSLSVQPPPEQIGKRPRRSARLACHLDKLAVVELQLCLQFLDTDSKLKAARCSRQLLHAASAPFAWRSTPPFAVEVQSPADVQSVQTSLLRFAAIHLRCIGMGSLLCVATVPRLVGLELVAAPQRSAAEFSRLLQHPNLARLQLLRLDDESSQPLTVDTARLIARLPQLRTFDVAVPQGADVGDLLQPLTDAPALTDFTVDLYCTYLNAATAQAINGCAGLLRLCLRNLAFSSGTLIALCSSPSMRRLQHLDLTDCHAASMWGPPDVEEYQSAFGALEQLQSLTLDRVYGTDVLLLHLHRAPALRRLSIRCERAPTIFDIGDANSNLPTRGVLLALLAAAPQLEVRLLVPASLEVWMADHKIGGRPLSEWQWHELQSMGAAMGRLTVVDWEPSDA